MKTRKLIPTIVLTVILLMAVSACGGDPAPAAEPPAENSLTEPENIPAEENSVPMEEAADEPEPTEETMPEEEPPAEAAVSFSADVLPILESRCLNCHGGDRVEGDLIVRTYADLMAGGEHGQAVIPGDVGGSLLAKLIIEQKMPKKGPKLTPPQTETILTWITEGAQDN